MLIQCRASDVLFSQLLTWEHKRKHCSDALMPNYPTKVFTVRQPSHLIKVINLQQLAQKINNWFRCKVPPPSYAACIFILTVNKIGSWVNLRKKNTHWLILKWRVFSCVLLQVVNSIGCYFLELNLIFTLCVLVMINSGETFSGLQDIAPDLCFLSTLH